MTRLDAEDGVVAESAAAGAGPRALLLESREVPLGGVRGMSVHRALPQRDLPLVGAWCFLDRFGPQVTRMRVQPHPHIGLQTVTWPFAGDIRHRDSVGSDVLVHRGELNLMTSGAGIAHSEYSVGEAPVELDALQLWVALPESRRHGEPAFERHEELPTLAVPARSGPPAIATVVLGELGGVRSPASVYTPIVGAEVRVPPRARIVLPLRPDWEYALMGVEGAATVNSGIRSAHGMPEDGESEQAPGRAGDTEDAAVTALDRGSLLYLGTGRESVEVAVDEDAVLFLLGGEPFEDEIVMWWNFVGRSHDEIVQAREAWEAGADRFGRVVDHGDERVPAPPLPGVRLTRRRRRV